MSTKKWFFLKLAYLSVFCVASNQARAAIPSDQMPLYLCQGSNYVGYQVSGRTLKPIIFTNLPKYMITTYIKGKSYSKAKGGSWSVYGKNSEAEGWDYLLGDEVLPQSDSLTALGITWGTYFSLNLETGTFVSVSATSYMVGKGGEPVFVAGYCVKQ